MMNIEKIGKLAWIILPLVAGGCSSAMVKLESSPDKAEVYVMPVGGAAPKMVGTTPLTAAAADLVKQRGGAGPVFIELRKPGYFPARTLVTELSAVDVELKLELQPTSGLEDVEKVNLVMELLFEGQRLARAGRLDDSMAKLKEAEKLAPQVAAVFELQGGVFYVQKKFKEALDAYSQAAVLDPKNVVAVRLRNDLEAKLGVKRRAPASEGVKQ